MSKVVAIVPARSGSVRLPGKNKKILVDKPMICYTIIEALKCSFIDEIIVTTDDKDIIDIVQKNYVLGKIRLIKRPEYLATSTTDLVDVIDHACQGYLSNTIILLLQPTSPLRLAEDIQKAWNIFNMNNRKLSVIPVFWQHPMTELKLVGSIFISYLSTIVNTRSFIHNGCCIYNFPYDRSIDIDTIDDFREAERILLRRLERNES